MAKVALCIGINDYPGTDSDLSGCVNDAEDWSHVLGGRGYKVTSLLNDRATRRAIADALTNLVNGALAGDSLVFTFSGHGSWLPDDNGDEPDRRDEMLCPYDIAEEQYLLDDDLAKIFAQKPENVRLYFISDSCHSGSVTRFAPAPLVSRSRMPKIKFLPPLQFVKDPEIRDRIPLVMRSRGSFRGEKYPALLLAGCKDVEFSYDADFDGRPNGALTRAAIDELQNNPSSPRIWFAGIRQKLPSQQYPQTPQLYGGTDTKRGPMF